MGMVAFYTAEMMVQEADNHGFQRGLSVRLIYDWASLGLLDYPAQPGHGRGHKSQWSEEQLQLFLVLLEKRKDTKRITALYNIPVWLWLYWGDRYASLNQVRRALGNWGKAVLRTWGRATTGVWDDAEKAARHFLDQLAYPQKKITGKRKLLRGLTELFYKGRVTQTDLVPIVQQILVASGKAATAGPAAYLFSAENVALQIAAGYEAIRHLDEISNGTFEWARRFININNRGYAREQPQLAKDSELGHLFARFDAEKSLNRACEDLAQAVGVTRLGLPEHIRDSLRDPNLWDTLQLNTEGELVKTRSGLIVPT